MLKGSVEFVKSTSWLFTTNSPEMISCPAEWTSKRRNGYVELT